MKLLVISHKLCWRSEESASSYATDGGFPFQMRAISELFDATTLLIPFSRDGKKDGEIPLAGHRLTVAPVSTPLGSGFWRKLGFPFWLLLNGSVLIREIVRADAVHVPIPSDVGTIGMLLSFLLHKPLFVRHCGNWFVQTTTVEKFWKWFIEKFAGGKNVMLATGGASDPPTKKNSSVQWIFSTSLTEQELKSCFLKSARAHSDSYHLIIVCRQEREKGTGVVIQSLPLVLKQYPQTTLEVVGDGGALAEFKALAESLQVSERVNFHGKVNHAAVLGLLQQADVFCYPTQASEGFPKVVLEAMACGLPVITTRVSVLPELIKSGCGILLEEASPEALAQAVLACFKLKEQRLAMSECAVKSARQYSLEQWRDVIGKRLRNAWGPLKVDA